MICNHELTSISCALAKEESSDIDEDEDERDSTKRSAPTRTSPRKTTTSPKVTTTTKETPVIYIDDDNNIGKTLNRNVDVRTGSTNEPTTTTADPRPYVSASSITLGSNNVNSANEITIEDGNEDVVNESHLVERIESVRNDPDGLTFHIKLVDENEARWISSKIANRRYPQAVIAFWESHVEFA